jgi:hypothetical protein
VIRTALQLAERGLAVFPWRPRGQRPATAHGCKDGTTDAAIIKQWWDENPQYNIGVATDAASHLFVVDIDDLDGEAALRHLEKQHGALPPTVEVITGRGRHIYFRYPSTGAV